MQQAAFCTAIKILLQSKQKLIVSSTLKMVDQKEILNILFCTRHLSLWY